MVAFEHQQRRPRYRVHEHLRTDRQRIGVAGQHQRRCGDSRERDLAAVNRARLRDQRLTVAAECVGERAERSRAVGRDRRRIVGRERRDDRVVGQRTPVDTAALDDTRADAAHDEPAHAIVPGREQQRDDRPHRIADEVDLLHACRLQQPAQVPRHAPLAVARRVVRLVRLAVPARVGCDHPAPRVDESRDHARRLPVGARVGDEPVVQHDRRRGAAFPPFVEGDLQAVVGAEAVTAGHLPQPIHGLAQSAALAGDAGFVRRADDTSRMPPSIDRAGSAGAQTTHVGVLRDAASTLRPPPGDRHGPLVPMLVVLTLLTGLVDAVSYLKLGHVFVANMTGNVVFLGFALAGAGGLSATASLIALASFLIGAFGGGWLGSRNAVHRGRLLRAATIVQAAFILLGLIVALLAGEPPAEAVRYTLIVVLALAMGVQNAAAQRLAVPELTTTVLTRTLTGLASEASAVGGSGAHAGRRSVAVVAMLVGALAGGLLTLHVSIAATLALALALGGTLAAAAHALSRSTAPWTRA